MLVKCLFVMSFCFLLAFSIAPLVIKVCQKLKASQTILNYVEAHKSKQGTATMGGFIFILATFCGAFFAFSGSYSYALLSVVVMLAYGTLGFLDDFIKVKMRQNLGLRAYQKIIGQVGIAFIIAFFVYNYVGTTIWLPFTNLSVDLGWFIIPFIVVFFLALVNSVNLIDGLDGLCSGVSISYLISFSLLLSLFLNLLNGQILIETENLIVVCFCLIGSLFAFFVYNGYPAKIFMGDTGSLAIGGFLSAVAVFSGLELYVVLLGLPYVLTSLSDILQVMYYKKTKKRIFQMAPLHHHFEKKGFNENKIVIVYSILTLFLGIAFFLIMSLIL